MANIIDILTGKDSIDKAYGSAKDNLSMVAKMLDEQYSNLQAYYATANTEYENMYNMNYGQVMTDAINELAGTGVFESPVSEQALGRTRTALATQYATGKSQLAAEKMRAESTIDANRVQYYMNLANLNLQQQQAKAQAKSQLLGTAGGIAAALLI